MTALLLVLLALLTLVLWLWVYPEKLVAEKGRQSVRTPGPDVELAAEIFPAAERRTRPRPDGIQDLDHARLLYRRHRARHEFAALEAELPIPSRYGADQAVLWAKDPWWLYCWWEFHSSIPPGRQRLLRVHDLTDPGAGRYWDIWVGPADDHWFIHVALPEHRYLVELGWLDENGGFRCVARTNEVFTPADGPAGWGERAVWAAFMAESLHAPSSAELAARQPWPGRGGAGHG